MHKTILASKSKKYQIYKHCKFRYAVHVFQELIVERGGHHLITYKNYPIITF